MKRYWDKFGAPLLLLGLILAGAWAIRHLSSDIATYQWDLKVYYHAATAADHGVDPYDKAAMTRKFGTSYSLPFIYPPVMLKVFRPLTWVGYETAYYFWLWLKLLAVGLLIWIWRRYIVPGCPYVWLLLFFGLAYDAAALLDFKAGNIAVFEQLFLWLAFWAFIKHRTALFCGIVVVLGLVKLSPIAFLALLLVPDVKRRWCYLGSSVVAFGSGIAANYLLWPKLFSGYLRNVLAIRESGIDYNHALLPFLRDLALPEYVVIAVYGICAVGLIGVTILLMKKAGKLILWRDRRMAVLLTCVLYVMLAPHMKGYSYLIMIPPALVLMREYTSRWLGMSLGLLILLPIRNPLAPWEASGILAHYYPLLLAYLVWGAWMYGLCRPTEPKPESQDTG